VKAQETTAQDAQGSRPAFGRCNLTFVRNIPRAPPVVILVEDLTGDKKAGVEMIQLQRVLDGVKNYFDITPQIYLECEMLSNFGRSFEQLSENVDGTKTLVVGDDSQLRSVLGQMEETRQAKVIGEFKVM
jgi:hypothetical protein